MDINEKKNVIKNTLTQKTKKTRFLMNPKNNFG